ncbi:MULTISPECIES: aminotransferase class V-fold PLP-dependent enzyme [unclassified Spirosoma]|uniref:aminotransferase class V-fold PLP-dependent enzyme n=1 Tax=unclassified Spirosoma TaxID=2621999 RepID=UPI000969AE9B|nr:MULTISPECIES: aminotransferase class V-fold PLP-dependent enzyme [unclassified Spirosoma]MBN8821386.1 aminotransferase class V-fold PLP-dependent enzyme [Spirosoma sp.]OJW78172.1 MAG: aminotransferase V [Spirosoma sp. 48-14]
MLINTTPLGSQKHQFSLPQPIHYLNCATRAPFSRAVEQAGHTALSQQADPFGLKPDDFFTGAVRVRALFSELINNPDPERIAVVPSVSYGMGVVARNLHRKSGIRAGQKIVMISDEFPSDVYAWDRVCTELGLTVVTVAMPAEFPKSELWNQRLLDAIDANTALVVVPPVHWMYGIRFDLETISKRVRNVGSWLVIDGTQAIGALPFDLEAIQPDAVVCAGYKWLMGPYSMGLAYFGSAFDEGIPLEESWMSRLDSNQFHKLMDYQPVYRPKAYRYNVGEHTHFLQMPMLETALTQLIDWQPSRIQAYAKTLLADAWPILEKFGCRIEPESDTTGRSHHLVGLWLPEQTDPMTVQQALLKKNVSVSARARVLRIAPHVYNDANDVDALVEVLSETLM